MVRERDTGVREPVLQLDPALPLVLEGVHAEHQDDHTSVVLSPRLWIDRSSTMWTDSDVGARGWQSRAQIAYELRHGFQLVGLAGYGQVATQFGHDLYFDVGIGIGKLFRISRWTTAWISLGVGARMWSGSPVAERTVMLHVGFTFR